MRVVVVVMAGMVMSSLRLGFSNHFAQFAFEALYMDFNTIVFGRTWRCDVHAVRAVSLIFAEGRSRQSKVRSAAALVGRGSAMSRKTHSGFGIN